MRQAQPEAATPQKGCSAPSVNCDGLPEELQRICQPSAAGPAGRSAGASVEPSGAPETRGEAGTAEAGTCLSVNPAALPEGPQAPGLPSAARARAADSTGRLDGAPAERSAPGEARFRGRGENLPSPELPFLPVFEDRPLLPVFEDRPSGKRTSAAALARPAPPLAMQHSAGLGSIMGLEANLVQRAAASRPSVATARRPDGVRAGADSAQGQGNPAQGLGGPLRGGRQLSALHGEVLRFAEAAAPTAEEAALVREALWNVGAAAAALWPGSRTVLFGSQATGLALPGSDLDVVVLGVSQHLTRAGSGYTREQVRLIRDATPYPPGSLWFCAPVRQQLCQMRYLGVPRDDRRTHVKWCSDA